MKGTIVKKANGRYYVATHHVDGGGKRVQKSHGGYGTKKEAERVLRDVLTKIDSATYVDPSRVTFADFLRGEWLPAVKVTNMKPSTLDSYEKNIDWHIAPGIGGTRLQALTPGQLNAFYAKLRTEGRKDGKGGLAPKTVRYIHGIVRKALADAARWGYVARNVADLADPPRQEATGRREMATWSPTEVRAFLDSTRDDRLFAAWILAASTGMRRGEVLGLRWKDVDFDAKRLHVRQTLISVDYKLHMSEPKTDRSRRSVPIDGTTIAALRSHRARQAEERLSWGPAYEDADLVFARENGTPIHPERLTQMFDLHVQRSGLPRIRLHDCRHSFATNAIRAGIPSKVVSEILGHSTASFTEHVYQHAIPAMQESAVELIADLVWKPGS